MTRLVEFRGTRYWLLGEAIVPLQHCDGDGNAKLEAALGIEESFAHVFGQEIVRFGDVIGTIDELADVGANRGYTLQQQLVCVRREIALRKKVYPKWTQSGRMPAEKADHEINCLQAVHDTLAALIALEAEPSPHGKRELETRI